MRVFRTYGLQAGGVLLALALAAPLGGCGDDECNHVLNDVATFEQCQQIAVERRCSPEVTYSRPNARCKVEDCGDCNGGIRTPTALPNATPAAA